MGLWMCGFKLRRRVYLCSLILFCEEYGMQNGKGRGMREGRASEGWRMREEGGGRRSVFLSVFFLCFLILFMKNGE